MKTHQLFTFLIKLVCKLFTYFVSPWTEDPYHAYTKLASRVLQNELKLIERYNVFSVFGPVSLWFNWTHGQVQDDLAQN